MALGGSDATKPVMPFYTLNVKAEEKILSLESKWQVHFDWLKDVVEEAKVKFAKPGEERELSLLPQTPGSKRGRRKRGSLASQSGEEPSSKRIDLDSTAATGRGGRAAAKAAQQRIANDVEEMANLGKKKRRPTALGQEVDTSANDTAPNIKNGSRVEFLDESSKQNDSVEASEEVSITSSALGETADSMENQEVIITPSTLVQNDENIETVIDNVEQAVEPLSVEPNEELVICSPQQVSEASRNSVDETFESACNETYDAPMHAEVANATYNMDNTEETNEEIENVGTASNDKVNGTFVLELEASSADETAANETFDVRKSDKESMSVDEDEALADNEAEDENEENKRKSKSLRKTSSMGPPRRSRSRQLIPDSEDEKTPVKKSRRTKSRSIGEIENQIPLINKEVTNVSEQSELPIPSPRRINASKSVSSQEDSNTSSRSTRTKQKQNTSVSSETAAEEKPSRSTRTKQKQNNSVSSEPVSQEDDVSRPSRSTRTKQKQDTSIASEAASVEEERPNSRSTRTRQKEINSVSSDTQEERPPSRSTRTKQKAPSSVSSQEEETSSKSSKTQLKETSSVSSDNPETEKPASRSTRTKQRAVDAETEEKTTRSTRTKQKQLQVETETQPESGTKQSPEVKRSTRTKQKLLSHQSQSGSGSDVASVASPRVRELVARAMSPSKNKTPSPRLVGYTGSPVMERVQVFEKAMRDSAGLKNKESGEETPETKPRSSRQSKSKQRTSSRTSRRSSIASSLLKVSAARRQSVVEVLETQDVSLVILGTTDSPARKGPVIRKSGGTAKEAVNSSRAPAGKVVKPMRVVCKGVTPVIRGMTPGSRGVTPGSNGVGSSRVTPGSGSLQGGRVRSRLGIMEKATKGTPGNMVARGGVTSFLPAKPKGPTLEEIQEQKEEERRRKEEKAADALKKKDELMKKKMDEQREKREERIRRVQEARQAKENEQEMKRNRAKETEEKLAALAKREKKLKEEAEKKKINEARMKEAEERKAKEEESRIAKVAHQEELKNREAAEQERRIREEEEKKRRMEMARREEEEKRKEKERKKEDERRLQNEAKKREAERIAREKEELMKIKNREAEKEKSELNSTYTKPADATLNQTKEAGPSSYDMTPSRHGGDLPPQPLENAEDYGIDDLESEGSTDNEDAPRKEVPKWAEGALLRTALLKQCYMCPDLDALFDTIDMPDLSTMFEHQRKRFYKRTSSAQWETPPTSFKLGNRW